MVSRVWSSSLGSRDPPPPLHVVAVAVVEVVEEEVAEVVNEVGVARVNILAKTI